MEELERKSNSATGAWKPATKSSLYQNDQSTEPIYKFTETKRMHERHIWLHYRTLGTGMGFASVVIIPAIEFFSDYPWMVVVILLVSWTVASSMYIFFDRLLWPLVRVRVFHDRIDILYGYLWPRRLTLEIGDILSIQIVKVRPFLDFGKELGAARGKDDWFGWLGLFGAPSPRGLAIRSVDQNVFIACGYVNEVSNRLREVLGGEDI